MTNMTKTMIGCFIKFNPLMGDEPYFSLLKEFKSKFVVKLISKSEKIGQQCSILLFNVKDINKYEDILDSIDYVYNSPIAIKFDESFFTENDHEYYLENIKLNKDKIYSDHPCNLAIFSNKDDLINYFIK